VSDATDSPRPDVLVQVFYDGLTEAIDWLCRVFGFAEQWRLPGPGGDVVMASLTRPNGGTLMVSGLPLLRTQLRADHPDRFRDPGTPWPNPYYSITVMVPDVDAHFAHAQQEGAHILSEPTTQPWGFRDYEVLDLEGRQWNFSQRLHEAAPEDWGAASSS